MNKIKLIGLSLGVISGCCLIFTGCGSSDDAVKPEITEITETGVFIDTPVKGLEYITLTKQGFTNINGEFQYIAGEAVEFKLGNLSFGSVTADKIISPYTMADITVGNNSNISTNIALILQNLDDNRSDAILDLSAFQTYVFENINLSNSPEIILSTISELRAANETQPLWTKSP